MRTVVVFTLVMVAVAIGGFGCSEHFPFNDDSGGTAEVKDAAMNDQPVVADVGGSEPADDEAGPGDDEVAGPGDADDDINQLDDESPNDDDTGDEPAVPDREFASTRCVIPDPEGLGEGAMLGGGAHDGTIVAYVYDDATCSPISGAFVTLGNRVSATSTDGEGRAALSAPPGPALITANAAGYSAWTYGGVSRVRYFRLGPYQLPPATGDSAEAHLWLNDEPLSLTNPMSLDAFFTQQAYVGLISEGFSRETAFADIYRNTLAANSFQIEYQYDYEHTPNDVIDFSDSFYLPDVSLIIEIPDLVNWGFWGGNTDIRVPVAEGAATVPLNAFVLNLDVGASLDVGAFLTAILLLVDADDPYSVLAPMLKDLIDRGVRFPYVASEPEWAAGDAPDLDLIDVGAEGSWLRVQIADAQPGEDYIAVLAAEVPNRTMAPLGVGVAHDGEAAIPAVPIPDADYVLVTAKTKMFATDTGTHSTAFVVHYAEDLRDWRDGVTIDDGEFPPDFSAATSYSTSSGLLKWGFDGPADGLDYVLTSVRRTGDNDRYFALLPVDLESATIPMTSAGFYSPWCWGLAALAVDLPGDNQGAFDPTRLFAYDNARYVLWTQDTIVETVIEMIFSLSDGI